MKVTVYSKPNCGACDITKQWLANNGIAFESIDAYEDEQAMAEIIEQGFQSFPVVKVNDWADAWTGFDYQKLEALK